MKPVPVMFEQQAQNAPDAIALIEGERRLRYGELNERVNRLAHDLQRLGVGPETLVGISIRQSIEAVIGVLGILKAGGAYVPLDLNYPKNRIDEMVRDTGLAIIVHREMVLSAQGDTENPECCCDIDSAAYVLYTSGSTGKPKGVIGIHRSIVNGLLSVEYAPDERCCLNASLSFGLSLANLFLPLMTGIPLVILSDEQIKDLVQFVNALEEHGITRVVLVPPVFNQMLELPRAGEKLRKIREVGVVGAALSSDLLQRFYRVMPQAKLHNTYSASEIGTLATFWRVPRGAATSGEIVIGQPVANTRVYLLDETMNSVAAGQIGEIYVGAPHLARGYLNQPQETSQRFVMHNGERLFRTGDFGRLRGDGEIEFVGRADDQVKTRGYRVALAEVERALTAIEGVREAAVVLHEISGRARLIGYVVSDGERSVTEFREYLRELLPEYMIPSGFVFLDKVPLSPNGKLDRAALPLPEPERPTLNTEYTSPRNAVEAELVAIWGELFGLERIGVEDHFLELGGDSLFAAQLAARIWERFRVELTLETLFDHGTIAEVAALIAATPANAIEPGEHVRSAAG